MDTKGQLEYRVCVETQDRRAPKVKLERRDIKAHKAHLDLL